MNSPYANDMKDILAALQERGDEQQNPLPDEEKVNTVYIYPTSEGGLLFTPTRIEGDEDPQPRTIVESEEETPQPAAQPTKRGEPPHILYFVLILLLFLFLDSADTTLTALMTPTATITITPQVKTITLTATMQLGKLLSPITLSESQTVPTTGHGHQDAKAATGTVTFYNGLFTQQFITQGTEFTSSDGVNIVTTQPAYIPAGNPNTGYGTVTVTAQAVYVGANGNINAGDVNTTINNGLLVKNNQFSGGQNERDFSIVTKSDTDTAAATLKAKVTASMTAALQGQLMPGESIQPTPCTPTVAANHQIGDEAETLEVTVSKTCNAIAYDTKELDTQATHLLTTQATKQLGQGYTVYGNVQVTVTKATTTNKTVVLLSFTTQATYLYQLNANAQQRIVTLIAGKPRETALDQLARLPGIQHASISGISDNQPIPDDLTHIHLLIVFSVFS